MTSFEKVLSTMLKPWFAVSFIILIIVCYFYLDESVAYFCQQNQIRQHWGFLNWITKIGLGAFYFITLFSLALFSRYVRKNRVWENRFWFLWLCVVFPSLICFFLKVLCGRARPDLLFGEQLYGFYGFETHASYWSFPSGHTTTIMGLVFGLAALFPKYCYAFISAGFFVAISRVMLTHHYLSDVLAAAYLALLEVGLLHCWLKRRQWLFFSNPNQELS